MNIRLYLLNITMIPIIKYYYEPVNYADASSLLEVSKNLQRHLQDCRFLALVIVFWRSISQNTFAVNKIATNELPRRQHSVGSGTVASSALLIQPQLQLMSFLNPFKLYWIQFLKG